MTPCALSVRRAFCTVTGLAAYWATSSRVEGIRVPGAAVEIQARRPVTMRTLLLS